ncbi:hypothetical protein [Rhizobium leguminosarum]|uniref:Uncharacterized protein n=1 Tax=Rhizobium leguminosarum TaxID=384 RepID=A0ABD7PIJ5_RHILE|nr:hypothetical protein [Rhizobium leguminosarum]TAV66664.1 hypothetical protein ELI28_25540 [Rhizobium leguminosarum]TAV67144.1 hypothetical protein ELI27_26530 [Rhizobium leguminosarum]TAW24607.1 hypothetical protein ELI19_24075 [Rhizobium leguminosarum]TAW38379.1 hypothetical protein ELI18_24045 [Rhizobium leguminosarum]TAZ27975.1 hypothetical protein ELH73_25535 [Rhizobium leguminosarum]
MGNAQVDRVGRVRAVLGFILVLVSLLSSPQSFAGPADIGGLTVTLPDPASGWRKAGKGPGTSERYKLSGYRLDLTDTNGKTESMSIFEPDKGFDGLLVINGSNYLKDDGK